MKNFCFIIIALIFTCKLSFSQEEDSQAIKKMKTSAGLTVEWLKKNIKISDEQGEEFLKILIIPEETIKEFGSLGKEYPDSLKVMAGILSANIQRDFESIFTKKQWEKYNSKKEEFGKWLEKKLKDLGY